MILDLEKKVLNLLTRALRDVNEKCETIPDPVQLEYHLPNNLSISVDREYDEFISKLSDLQRKRWYWEILWNL